MGLISNILVKGGGRRAAASPTQLLAMLAPALLHLVAAVAATVRTMVAAGAILPMLHPAMGRMVGALRRVTGMAGRSARGRLGRGRGLCSRKRGRRQDDHWCYSFGCRKSSRS